MSINSISSILSFNSPVPLPFISLFAITAVSELVAFRSLTPENNSSKLILFSFVASASYGANLALCKLCTKVKEYATQKLVEHVVKHALRNSEPLIGEEKAELHNFLSGFTSTLPPIEEENNNDV